MDVRRTSRARLLRGFRPLVVRVIHEFVIGMRDSLAIGRKTRYLSLAGSPAQSRMGFFGIVDSPGPFSNNGKMLGQSCCGKVGQHGSDSSRHLSRVGAVMPYLLDSQIDKIAEVVLGDDEAQRTVCTIQTAGGEMPGAKSAQEIVEDVDCLAGGCGIIGGGRQRPLGDVH